MVARGSVEPVDPSKKSNALQKKNIIPNLVTRQLSIDTPNLHLSLEQPSLDSNIRCSNRRTWIVYPRAEKNKQNSTPIGYVHLHSTILKKFLLSVFISNEHRMKGYGTEALKAVIKDTFKSSLYNAINPDTLFILINKKDKRFKRVSDKLGFEKSWHKFEKPELSLDCENCIKAFFEFKDSDSLSDLNSYNPLDFLTFSISKKRFTELWGSIDEDET
ncbi:hypothetical protein HDU92_000400 [Lobulomyces angularis]|nr:hypothetical protein HDU92_000400 [Lobulomyces angularis]